MSEYQQNFSGFPIDPAQPGPHEGRQADAEATAYLPPVPPAPASGYPPQAPHASYASYPQNRGYPAPGAGVGGHPYPHEAPGAAAEQTALLPPVLPQGETDPSMSGQSRFDHIQAKYGTAEQPQATTPAPAEPEASPWPAGWERPPAPPQTWAPAPAPQPQAFPAHGQQPPFDPTAPSRHPYPAQGGGHPAQAPAAGGPYAAGGLHQPPPSHPQPGGPQGQPFGPGVGSVDPGQGGVPGGVAGQAAPLSPEVFAPVQPGGPQGQSFGPGVGPVGPAGVPGVVGGDQGGGSLRQAFASAQPTGPAPQAAARPLAPSAGGSLREAFAGAQPTGPGVVPGGMSGVAATPAAAAAPAAASARARGGSPIIDPGVQPGVITLGLGALIGVAALAGKFGLVLPVALLQAVTAAGWFRLNGMWPARQGIALAALGGFVADAAILAASAHSSGPAILAGTLGAFFLLVLILQIFRPSNPDERFYALTVCASATVVTVLGGAFLAVGSGKAVLAGAAAAGVAAAVSAALRRPPVIGFAAGGFLSLLVGGGLAAATGLGLTQGLLLGLGAGVCALIGRRVAAYDFPSRFVHMTAGVALPLALAAPMVYLIAR